MLSGVEGRECGIGIGDWGLGIGSYGARAFLKWARKGPWAFNPGSGQKFRLVKNLNVGSYNGHDELPVTPCKGVER